MNWYSVFRWVVRGVVGILVRLEVTGRENIPERGPFLLIANHQGTLDPLLVQGSCHRTVHTFTKSTQFSSGPVFRWLLPRINAIPARRYRVDPQVVRIALRLLKRGEAVGIYPEGERSWDGTLQPFRRGTVRLILKAGVPVVPCGIAGSFRAWPRWSRRPTRARVSVRFGEPIHFGVHDRRHEREEALEATTARIARVLVALSQESRPADRTGA